MNSWPRFRGFALLCLVSVVLWLHVLIATCTLALRNDGYTHILLVAPISIGLIWAEWRSRRSQPEWSFGTGSVLLVLAIVLGAAGGTWWGFGSIPADLRLTLSMLAFAIWWIGSFVCCFGTGVSRQYVFALCFLLWLVPLPEFALTHIEGFLQQTSASCARLLFNVADVPVTQGGVVLSIPGLTLEVAKECSSIRSSLMLIVTAMVMAHLLLRSTWGKVVVSLAAIPLSVVKNGVRVFTLGLLGAYVDPGYLHGRLHRQGGIVFFFLGVFGLFAILGLVRHTERKITPHGVFERSAAQTAASGTSTKSLSRR